MVLRLTLSSAAASRCVPSFLRHSRYSSLVIIHLLVEYKHDDEKANQASAARKREKSQRTKNKPQFAAKMRANPTSLERILYDRIVVVIGSRTHIHLEKQRIHSGYILDAYIPELSIAFEADGPFHRRAYDAHRDWVLRKNGIRVIRFGEEELRTKVDWVDHVLESHLGRSVVASD